MRDYTKGKDRGRARDPANKRGKREWDARVRTHTRIKEEKDRDSPSSKTHPVAFQSLRAVLLLLLEAAAALALVEYVRRELPALGAGATDARRAARHRDTCELTATTGQHRSPLTAPLRPPRRRQPRAISLLRQTFDYSSCSVSEACRFTRAKRRAVTPGTTVPYSRAIFVRSGHTRNSSTSPRPTRSCPLRLTDWVNRISYSPSPTDIALSATVLPSESREIHQPTVYRGSEFQM